MEKYENPKDILRHSDTEMQFVMNDIVKKYRD